jgi:hypothetical protein
MVLCVLSYLSFIGRIGGSRKNDRGRLALQIKGGREVWIKKG